MIDSDAKLATWLDKIEACSVIGLDTEADSLYSYPERLCLLQLALADDLLLIDPLSGLNLQPLWRRLKKAELVIHAADYDLRLLASHCGFAPPRVFDTMRAAQFLGFRELALQRLVSHFFQVRLEKGARKSDWGKRPLTPKMREYALNDVRYLLPLYKALKSRLREAGPAGLAIPNLRAVGRRGGQKRGRFQRRWLAHQRQQGIGTQRTRLPQDALELARKRSHPRQQT